MYITGIMIGVFTFVIIGVFHPIVIKCEYYFTHRIWPVFLIVGLLLLIGAFFTRSLLISSLLSITGFSCLWSIIELKEQRERVRKGWFPKNPKHTSD